MGAIVKAKDLQRAALPAAESIAAEIAVLERLDLGQLRVQYRNRTGRIAPTRISRPLLLRVLAHQIQVEAFGDLGRDARRMLDRLGKEAQRVRVAKPGGMGIAGGVSEVQDRSVAVPAPAEAPFSLKPGTMLGREWHGRMEQVMALDEGFAWNGKTHASLSAVAFAITGTRWNGHRFFGLRDRKTSPSRPDDRVKPAAGPAPASASRSCESGATTPGNPEELEPSVERGGAGPTMMPVGKGRHRAAAAPRSGPGMPGGAP